MMYKKDNRMRNFYLTVLFLCAVFACMMAPSINKVTNKRQVTVTVVDKGIKNNRGSGQYLIYCKDQGGGTQVYQIADSLFKMRFDSSDVYADLEVGVTYEFTVCGKRVPILSWYPNIYGCEVPDEKNS